MELKKRQYRFKEGVGPHFDGHKEYAPGDVIELMGHEGESFMDKLIPLDPPEDDPEPQPEAVMIIVETSGGYDVINDLSKEKINNTPLDLQQAQSLAGPDAEVVQMAVDPEPIKAVHRGGGRYAIVWEKTREPLTPWLFNRSEADKVLKNLMDGVITPEDLKDGKEEG